MRKRIDNFPRNGSQRRIKDVYFGLAGADSALSEQSKYSLYKRFEYLKSALQNFRLYVAYEDSLINEEAIKKSERERGQFEYDKKESISKAENEKKSAIAAAENHKQRIIIWSVIILMIIILLFFISLTLYNRFKTTNRQKKIIEKQKKIIHLKNSEICTVNNLCKTYSNCHSPSTKSG